MTKTVLSKIPKAQRYELNDVPCFCGPPWREMEKVPDDCPDVGDLWVEAADHENLRRDMAVAIEVGNTAIGLLTKEHTLLRSAHKEYEYLLESVLEAYDNADRPNTPANDALTAWKNRNEGEEDKNA